LARIVGLDFGTTNSALAIRDDNAAVRLAGFPTAAGVRPTFRSILFFDADEHGPNTLARPAAGGEAIARYLDSGGNGRLLLSLKSFLADRTFSATDIFGRRFTLEELIALILVPLRRAAELQFGDLGRRLIVGRPVRFSGAANAEDEERALRRLRTALAIAGWEEVSFEYEPIAAAYHYGAELRHEEILLVGDFGGGTSDFSLLRVTPRSAGAPDYEILGSDGVAIAGDAFDGRIVHHLVAPELGLGSSYRTPYGKILPMPTTFYSRLERWHYLSMLKAPATMNKLRELQSQALEPQKIAAFIHIVADDLAYSLFVAVERAKVQLSERDAARFAFADPPLAIEKTASRPEFEHWIDRERDEIGRCVDGLMVGAGIQPARVDTVFLTGGSSFVPAIRQIFSGRFESATIRTGDEFISVAGGLALRDLRAQ
jgi:hypothetical chaperone protein